MLTVTIIKAKRCGLDVYKVYINRVYAAEFLSQAGATTYIASKYKSCVFKTCDMSNQ